MAKKKSSKQEVSTTKSTGGKKSPQPTVYVCPYTNQNVYIGKATLKDLKSKSTFTNTSKRLWILPSPQVRNDLYLEAAKAIATREQALLPSFGGRSWEVTCKLTEPLWSSQVLFRSWKGKMELAVLPHFLEKIPTPPTWPGRRTQPDEYEGHEDEDLGLQQREISSLSSVAWDLKDAYPVPNVTLKWQSPERKIFNSRKTAWEHATVMAAREVEINKCLLGIGSSGKLLKPFIPSLSTALKVGQLRFERDGLWVVGQELAWQEGRPQELLEEEQAEEERKRVPKSGLELFLMSKRNEYRDTHDECTTFKQAEAELRKVWKAMSRAEKKEWNKQVRGDEESAMEEEIESMETEAKETLKENSPQEPKPLKLTMTPQAFFVKSRRHEYREERRAQKRSLSLSECDTWLRQEWKTLDPKVKEDWTQKLIEYETKKAEEEAQAQRQAREAEQAAADLARESEQAAAVTTEAATEQPHESEQAAAAEQPHEAEPVLAENVSETGLIGKAKDMAEQEAAKAKPPNNSFGFDIGHVPSNLSGILATPSMEATRKNGAAEENVKNVVTDLELQDDNCPFSKHLIRNSLQNATCADSGLTVTSKIGQLEGRCVPFKSEPIVVRAVPNDPIHQSPLASCDQNTEEIEGHVVHTSPCGHANPSTTLSESAEHEEEKKEDDALVKVSSNSKSEHSTIPSNLCTIDEADSDRSLPPVPSSVSRTKKMSSSRKASSKKQQQIIPTKQVTQRWCLNEEQIDLCYAACMDHYETVMRTVKSRDLHRELQDGFDVLRERGFGRYDMELPAFDDSNMFGFLTDLTKAPWMPVVKAILGDDAILIHKGCFLSMPGSAPQEYHQDGVHLTTQTQRPCHAINVFIPLVDLNSRNGPTEFCLGSHILGLEGYDRDFVEIPKPKAGTPVIFDYRLGHRGLGNNSSRSCRPVVYCTYARAAQGKEFRDSVNFSRKRYHKIGELSSKPLSREERCNKRKRSASEKEDEDLKRALEESVAATTLKSQDVSGLNELVDGECVGQEITEKSEGTSEQDEDHGMLNTKDMDDPHVKRVKVQHEAIAMVLESFVEAPVDADQK